MHWSDSVTDPSRYESVPCLHNPSEHGGTCCAQDPTSPPELLAFLAQDEDLRSDVAANPSTPADVLARLLTGPAKNWKTLVASVHASSNPSTPADALAAMASHEDPNRRSGVARNPSMPAEVVEQLAADPYPEVRAQAAQNPNLRADVLARLSTESDPNIRAGVASNPSTPPEVLADLARPFDMFVGYNVARNPNTPDEVWRALRGHFGDHLMRNLARDPLTPAQVLMKLPTWILVAERRWDVLTAELPEDVRVIARTLATDGSDASGQDLIESARRLAYD